MFISNTGSLGYVPYTARPDDPRTADYMLPAGEDGAFSGRAGDLPTENEILRIQVQYWHASNPRASNVATVAACR